MKKAFLFIAALLMLSFSVTGSFATGLEYHQLTQTVSPALAHPDLLDVSPIVRDQADIAYFRQADQVMESGYLVISSLGLTDESPGPVSTDTSNTVRDNFAKVTLPAKADLQNPTLAILKRPLGNEGEDEPEDEAVST